MVTPLDIVADAIAERYLGMCCFCGRLLWLQLVEMPRVVIAAGERACVFVMSTWGCVNPAAMLRRQCSVGKSGLEAAASRLDLPAEARIQTRRIYRVKQVYFSSK